MPSESECRVRLVVPVHGKADGLREFLEAVAGSDCGRTVEVVIVDDGENCGLQEAGSAYPVTVRVSDTPGSAARARNLGAEGFDGDVIVFIDSDVKPEPSAISRLVAPILEGRAEATVGNYSRELSGMSFAEGYKELYLNRVYSRVDGYLRNEFWTALGAVKTSVFHELGGFYGNVPRSGGEDIEFGHRLSQAGCRILAVPNACGKHLRKLRLVDLLKNDIRKGSSTVSLFLGGSRPLSDFRHCHYRDMFAVASASTLAALACVMLVSTLPWSFGIPAELLVLVTYLWSRSDLMSAFARQPGWFLPRAILLMFVLDLVRAACVFRGGASLLWQHSVALLRSRHAHAGVN